MRLQRLTGMERQIEDEQKELQAFAARLEEYRF